MSCSSCAYNLEETFHFCPNCGTRTVHTSGVEETLSTGVDSGSETEKEIIESYFYAGYEYNAILSFLCKHHAITMSLSTLKRRLKHYGLKRKTGDEVNNDELTEIIRNEIDGPSCVSGYRALWHTLRLKYGICVPRARVQVLLKEIDPDGTEQRKRHRLQRRAYKSPGPNQCWHVDGYDKLKPYGFPIHGAIDGYSRRVLWLKVTRTNNNPAVIAKFYHDCIEELGGCPRILTTDPGTENVHIAALQCYLRGSSADDLAGEKSHRYVASTANQRIECWWSSLRRSRTSWWINFFKDLSDNGVYINGDMYHDECLWFCFNEILQQDLDFFRIHWNTHRIRQSRHDTVAGRPDELFFMPESFGGEDQMQPVTDAQLEVVASHCEEPIVDNDYHSYFTYVVDLQRLAKPRNWKECLHLFEHLIRFKN